MILALDAFIILTPFAWGTAWWFALKAIGQDRKNWRNRLSLTALGITTLAGLLWLPAGLYSAHFPGSASSGQLTIGLRVLLFCAASPWFLAF